MKKIHFLLSGLMLTSVMQAEEEISFNKQIRPILADRCYHCHGPDAKGGQKGALRLDDEAAAKADLYALKRKKRGRDPLPAAGSGEEGALRDCGGSPGEEHVN